MTDADNQFNISAVSIPSELNAELGHQVVSPVWGTTTRHITSGFFTSLALNFGAPSLGDVDRAAIGAFLGCFAAMDTAVSDYAKQLSFEHEYAREEWEHEFNPIGEVDEYVAYTSGLGIPPSKARDIAMLVTAEPSISVPYHLAFELSMLQPKFYRRKLYHAGIVLSAYGSGFIVAELVKAMTRTYLSRVGAFPKVMLMSGGLGLVLTPVIFGRYQSVYHVEGSSRFKILATVGYVTCIFAAVLAIKHSLK